MQLETPRLILRTYRPDDWERVHIYGSQHEVTEYEAWGPNTVNDTKKFVRESQESRIAMIGWITNPEFQNHGYATEAARAVIKFGFEKLGLVIIYATCDARNGASMKVMEKIGMKRVGLLKNEREQKGEKRDTLRYEIAA